MTPAAIMRTPAPRQRRASRSDAASTTKTEHRCRSVASHGPAGPSAATTRVAAPGFAPASRGGGAGIKDAARRLRRSASPILDTVTPAARCDCVAGTKERRLQPNQGTGWGWRRFSMAGEAERAHANFAERRGAAEAERS